MEKAAGRRIDYLRRGDGGNARTNGARTSGAAEPRQFHVPDFEAIVDCLFAAHYSEDEILDYLTGPLGVPDAEAAAVLRAARS